jgi:hypothetical protein
MRLVALALVLIVPCTSLAHGLGPGDDAPVQPTPSARLLPADKLALAAPEDGAARMPAPAATDHALTSSRFWVGMSLLSAATVVAVGLAVFIHGLSRRHFSMAAATCPAGASGATCSSS